MRLLDVDSLELREFLGDEHPPYTILSHTWELEEVTFQDLQSGSFTRAIGFRKVLALCNKTKHDGYQYTWIDTCCIDSSRSSELSEAINFMYRWYAGAAACYVYLSDVHHVEAEANRIASDFSHSRWFKRIWTLQELIAPRLVIFFDSSWYPIGDKNSLLHVISEITGIPGSCLSGEKTPAEFSIATRFSWASTRTCTRPEDTAYSLMGLFNINMPILYGEREKAFIRLQEEIVKQIDDQSILAWSVSEEDPRHGKPCGVFARSPADFLKSAGIQPFASLQQVQLPPSIPTSRGLSITLPLDSASAIPAQCFSKDCDLDFAKLQVAYLHCGPSVYHAVQVILVSLPTTSRTTLSSATFYRLATQLMIVERPQKFEYSSIHISIRLDDILPNRQPALHHKKAVLTSSGSDSRIVYTSHLDDKDISGFELVNSAFVSKDNIQNAIVDILDENMVSNIAGKLFLPEGTLDKILDQDIMTRVLRGLPPSSGSGTESIRYFPNLSRCRKIFAILASIGLIGFFETIVRKLEVNDECLPMPEPRFTPNLSWASMDNNSNQVKKWEMVAQEFGRKVHIRMFFEKQWSVLAPVFRRGSHIRNFSFTEQHILPFVPFASDAPNGEAEHSVMNVPKSGGFGVIRKVYIHPCHHDFSTGFKGSSSDKLIHDPRNFFAIKSLRGSDGKGFETERTALELLQRSGSRNILQLFATYVILTNPSDPIPDTYNMIFPWAEGNLKELWETNRHRCDKSIIPWMAEQCWKLADALKFIHKGYESSSTALHGPEQLHGSHGDIKPVNILRFSSSSTDDPCNLGQLVIGDFGLTSFHRENTILSSSSSVAFSVTYSAPEFIAQGAVPSRKADIWALGCVFLEFIVWFLMGPESVNHTFPNQRISGNTTLEIPSDRFFEVIWRSDGRPSSVTVKPVVLRWMQLLHDSDGYSDYIHDFLELIRHQMLTVDVSARVQAIELSAKLEQMYKICLSRPQYYRASYGPRRSSVTAYFPLFCCAPFVRQKPEDSISMNL
ncbi:kinase-like domain-containing protein [Nemania sp. FL0916]|nr:kinase-like domain-containing protein [Nemania sp. FL0916]